MDFTNKVVIITGASSGIGAASAILFAKHGAKLSLIARNEQRLKTVAEKCREANGFEHIYLALDLTAEGSCNSVVNQTVAKFGRIDVLVNCAAKLLVGSLFDDNIDTFDEMIDINLRVPYKLTHLALPYLVKTRGNIINFNGTKYTRIRHGFLPYSISKAGLERFTKSAAIELASEGVRVNCLQPGVTRTNILSNLDIGEEESQKTFERLTNNNNIKILEPEEVAKMVVFVASGVCPNINGADLSINGASALL
ncbi:putative oxidoreductase SERP2049 [Anticarsia gemmatalis]|uniref:putative oxidoreductase SERP2049 n=1 Tax=Anticarsia gemmatalis TaxID=129554 RepID=UPI003F767CA8